MNKYPGKMLTTVGMKMRLGLSFRRPKIIKLQSVCTKFYCSENACVVRKFNLETFLLSLNQLKVYILLLPAGCQFVMFIFFCLHYLS